MLRRSCRWSIGSRTISVCDLGDAVCDYDADAEEVTPARGRHPYELRPSAPAPAYAWTTPVYQPPRASHRRHHQVPVPELDARAINSTTTPAGSSSAASTTTMASTAPGRRHPGALKHLERRSVPRLRHRQR